MGDGGGSGGGGLPFRPDQTIYWQKETASSSSSSSFGILTPRCTKKSGACVLLYDFFFLSGGFSRNAVGRAEINNEKSENRCREHIFIFQCRNGRFY